jgi:methionyl aminopeptidase
MIHIKNSEQIEQMKAAGAVSKAALRRAGEMVRPGITTREIDQVVESYIRLHGATPTFKGYSGFPASICSSVNEQIVHGIPSPAVALKDGDIISIDTGANVDGWAGDNAWTFYVGEVSDEVRGLCECTRDCLKAAIKEAVPGNHLGDLGHAVQTLAESNGYGIVRDYVGHGIGHDMHEDPNVPNYGKPGRGVKLQVGMIIAIEPMITLGSPRVKTLNNGWTVVTRDGKPAAHYENVVAITEDGPVILSEDETGPWCAMFGGADYVELKVDEIAESDEAPEEEKKEDAE